MPEFQTEFIKSKGQPITYKNKELRLLDKLIVNDNQRIKLTIEEINSDLRQGVALNIDRGSIIYSNQEYKKKSKKGVGVSLWAEVGKEYELCFKNTSGHVYLWNFWENKRGTTGAWTMGAAMIVEEIPNGRRYRCNDWEPDEDFDDIVFRIELLD